VISPLLANIYLHYALDLWAARWRRRVATARRLRGAIGSVFRYAIVTLRASSDPTTATHGALLAPLVQHRSAIIDEGRLGALMRSIDEFDGWPSLRAALQFLALTFARPGEVRGTTHGRSHRQAPRHRMQIEIQSRPSFGDPSQPSSSGGNLLRYMSLNANGLRLSDSVRLIGYVKRRTIFKHFDS
jgi:hypothetical protein